MASLLTNGHAKQGLRHPDDQVMSLPLKKGGNFQLGEPFVASDSNGLTVAAFRNKTDQEDFIAMVNRRKGK